MKQFVLTLIAVFIGGFLALLGYDRFVVEPREARAKATADASADTSADPARIAPDMGAARAEAEGIASALESSAQRSVENARRSLDAQASDLDRRARVVDAVQRATMFRVALTEYYQSNGRWPRDADEAGLPSSEEMRGGAVNGVEVGAEGMVTITLDDSFAPGSRIVLRPSANATGGVVDWRCEVEGDAALKQSLPRCAD